MRIALGDVFWDKEMMGGGSEGGTAAAGIKIKYQPIILKESDDGETADRYRMPCLRACVVRVMCVMCVCDVCVMCVQHPDGMPACLSRV